MGKVGSWRSWEVGKGGRRVRLGSWERWEDGEFRMVGRKQRGRIELPLELHASFLGIVVGKSKCGKMRWSSKEKILYK